MLLKKVKPIPKRYKIAYALLDNVKRLPKKIQAKSNVPSRTLKQRPNNDKFDIIINKAIDKHLLEEEERDIKKIELESLSEEDFQSYVQEVESADDIEVGSQQEEELSEAEIALQNIKSGALKGADWSKMSDTSFSNNNETRDLSSIKSERKPITAKSSMSDIKGLTKPIVQPASQFPNSISDVFSNMEWSMGKR